jgi:hypothetical protein
MIKYGETEIAQTPDVVFWASVYKAICGIKDAPGKGMAARAGMSLKSGLMLSPLDLPEDHRSEL